MRCLLPGVVLLAGVPARTRPEDPLARLRDREQRVFAAYELAAQGEAVVPDLLRAAADPDPHVRRWALWALALLGPRAERAAQVAVGSLTDPVCETAAIEVLARMGTAALPAIRELLGEPGRRRTLALVALARMGLPEARAMALPVLAEDLGDISVCAHAVNALLTPGLDPLATLTAVVSKGDAFAAARAAEVLAALGKPRAFRRSWSSPPIPERVLAQWEIWYRPGDHLARLLQDLTGGEPWLRREAAWELRKRAGDCALAQVLAALRQALQDPPARAAAATTLAIFGHADTDVLAGLREALADEELRPEAAVRLTAAGVAAPPVAALLERLLMDQLFGETVGTLVRVPVLPEAAAPVLAHALRDAPAMTARDALLLCRLAELQRVPIDPFVTALARLVEHRDPEAVVGAAIHLRRLGPRASAAAPALARVLGRQKPPTAAAVALALLEIDPDSREVRNCLAQLLPLLEPAPERGFDLAWPDRQHPLASALLRRAPVLGPALAEALGQATPEVARHAALLLGRMQPSVPEAVSHLLRCLESPDPDLRGAAAWALGRMHVDRERCLPALFQRLPAGEWVPFPPWQWRTGRGAAELRFAQDQTVAWAIVQFGAEAVPILLARLRTGTGVPATLWLLGMMGAPAVVAAPAIVPLLHGHADPQVRRTAAFALGAIGVQPVFSPVGDLARALRDEETCGVAVHGLGILAATDDAALRALVRAVPETPTLPHDRLAVPAGGPKCFPGAFAATLHRTLTALGPRAARELEKLAAASDDQTRSVVEELLARIASQSRTAGGR